MLKSYLPLAHSSDQPPLFLVYIPVAMLSENFKKNVTEIDSNMDTRHINPWLPISVLFWKGMSTVFIGVFLIENNTFLVNFSSNLQYSTHL